jgi:hypothetical protein
MIYFFASFSSLANLRELHNSNSKKMSLVKAKPRVLDMTPKFRGAKENSVARPDEPISPGQTMLLLLLSRGRMLKAGAKSHSTHDDMKMG